MRILFLILTFLITLPCLAAQSTCTWAPNQLGIGPALTVHGRLSLWNGGPPVRIWVIGTTRMLGVVEDATLPDNVRPYTQSFETELVGDFMVCPLTRQRPGVMQRVGIVSASHLRARTRG